MDADTGESQSLHRCRRIDVVGRSRLGGGPPRLQGRLVGWPAALQGSDAGEDGGEDGGQHHVAESHRWAAAQPT
jgi:hypothetical protein